MDHTDTGLRAVVKALKDVVAPALNPADPLALEQLRLAVDYIEFVRARFEHFHDRERFELSHHLGMATSVDALAAPITGAAAAALKTAIGQGAQLAADPGATTRALKAGTAALAAAVAKVVHDASTLDVAARRMIEQTVLQATDDRIEFERAWYLPLGFDPAPGDVKDLGALHSYSMKQIQ